MLKLCDSRTDLVHRDWKWRFSITEPTFMINQSRKLITLYRRFARPYTNIRSVLLQKHRTVAVGERRGRTTNTDDADHILRRIKPMSKIRRILQGRGYNAT